MSPVKIKNIQNKITQITFKVKKQGHGISQDKIEHVQNIITKTFHNG